MIEACWFYCPLLLIRSNHPIPFLLRHIGVVFPLLFTEQAEEEGQNGSTHQSASGNEQEKWISAEFRVVVMDSENDQRNRTQGEHEQMECVHVPRHFPELLNHIRFSFRAE